MMPVTWNPEPFVAKVTTRVSGGLEQAATEVQRLARTIAPVRKSEPYKRKGRKNIPMGDVVNVRSSITGTFLPSGGLESLFMSKGPLGARLRGEVERQGTRLTGPQVMHYNPKGKPVRMERKERPEQRGPEPWSAIGLAKILKSSGYEFAVQTPLTGPLSSRAQKEVAGGNFQVFLTKNRYRKEAVEGPTPTGKPLPKAKVGLPVEIPVLRYGGGLRRSINKEGAPRRQGNKLVVTVRAYASYAVFVEFGTRYARAQPFLLPALESVKPRVISMMKGGQE